MLHILRFAFLFVLLLCAGCNDTGGRLSLSGTVSINGTPVKSGALSIAPSTSTEGATYSGATITDGRYSIPAAMGVTPGEYLVRITVTESTGIPDPNAEIPGATIIRQLVPPKYNKNTELKINVAKGKQSFNFDLVVDEKDF